MVHESVPITGSIQIINLKPNEFSPLISKCQIKVCYVQDGPNRNTSIITKETGLTMAPSLRGAMIVGYYNENIEDFEEHNQQIDISGGKFKIKSTTMPYGFVDINANVWYQDFQETDSEGKIVVRTYLMTEGWLWTEAFPECRRVIEKGNNQSMELDNKTIDAYWSKDKNGEPQFFIINKALISKLCILGDDMEPCFEGARITGFDNSEYTFSFNKDFQKQANYIMEEFKKIIEQGGAQMSITGNENEPVKEVIEFSTPVEESQISPEVIQESENEFKKKNEDKNKKDDNSNSDNNSEDEEHSDDNDEDDDSNDKEYGCKKKKSNTKCSVEAVEVTPAEDDSNDVAHYNLEEIPEYIQLKTSYEELTTTYNSLKSEYDGVIDELNTLREFKKTSERKDKETLIDGFYMLSDEDKSEVRKNIDSYSLEDIEAKLSIICVRNRVSFALPGEEEKQTLVTYSLGQEEIDTSIPAWVKAACEVAKELQ